MGHYLSEMGGWPVPEVSKAPTEEERLRTALRKIVYDLSPEGMANGRGRDTAYYIALLALNGISEYAS